MDTERRKFSRISIPGEDCHLGFGDQSYIVKLHDESISGFSVSGLNTILLAKNLPVRLNFRENSVLGICKNVVRVDRKFRIGIERSYSNTPDAIELETGFQERQFMIVPFIEFQGNYVKCTPLEMIDTMTVRVLLWNGRQFEVGRESIHALTREEREKVLQQEQVFDTTCEIYSTYEFAPEFVGVQTLVDYEFGSDEEDDLYDCLARCETLLSTK